MGEALADDADVEIMAALIEQDMQKPRVTPVKPNPLAGHAGNCQRVWMATLLGVTTGKCTCGGVMSRKKGNKKC